MNVTIKELKHCGKNMANKKEIINAWNLLAFDEGKFKELATVRWYMGRASTASIVYCTIWVTSYAVKDYCSGTGTAGGGGYHKPSAAFESAINDSGIYFDKEIGGRGDYAVEEALLALAKHARFENVTIVKG